MLNYFESHTQYQEAFLTKSKCYNDCYLQYKKDLKEYFMKLKMPKVLEIWSWMWKFAYFCDKIWVKDYTWIDIDDYFFDENKKDFPHYLFIKTKFQEYLKDHQNKYDVIFVSHVFEHLDEKERGEMIRDIYSWLKNGWIRINYMPNADSALRVWTWRRNDITHKTIYTENSFSQVIKSINNNFIIKNVNTYVWVKSIFRRFIHMLFLFFSKIYYLWMWYPFPKIYTFEMLSVLTKKCR